MITTPFLPPRPMMGEKLTAENVIKIAHIRRANGYSLTRKLNGDHGILESTGGGVLILWNRFGGIYSNAVDLSPWKGIGRGLLLDGEIWKQRFYPWERIDVAVNAQDRLDYAKTLCHACKVDWMYGPVDDDWLVIEAGMPGQNPRTRTYEGFVSKLITSKYTPAKTVYQECPFYIKDKWT